MKKAPDAEPGGAGVRVVLLRATFNAGVVDGLVEGARRALLASGVAAADIATIDVPGAFELPLAAAAAAHSGRFDAIVALGAVIRGQTDHYEHIAREAASGLAAVARETGVPVGFGVLTAGKERQARERARAGKSNKGAEAARAALAMVHVVRSLAESHGGTESRREGKPRLNKTATADK